jgi:signal peptidase I
MREVGLTYIEFSDISAQVLNNGGSFSFQAHGSSMYPFICDGDILTVKQVEYSGLKVGDIIFYKSLADRLVVHRIVGEKKQTDQQFFLTRGDALLHNDGWIYYDRVLGKVVSIQQGKKFIFLNQATSLRPIMYFWNTLYPLGPFFLNLISKGKGCLSWVLHRLQTPKIYRIIARALINGKISYHIATEKDAYKLLRLYGYEQSPEIENPVELLKNQLQNPGDYGHTFIARKREKIIGTAILTSFPKNSTLYPDWWIFGMMVRTRYRGAGIGEGLMRMVMEKASEGGVSSVNLLVFKENKAAISLYHKVGFRRISIPKLDKQLEEDVQKGQRRRIIMSSPIESTNIQ